VTEARASRVLRGSAVLTVAGLAFMLWSLVKPTAMPVVLAMSLGQMLGTLAFAMFGWVVFSELRDARRIAAKAEATAATAATTAEAEAAATKTVAAAKTPTSGDRT
jgi:Na+/melibiose symporter-like transporter